MICKQAATIERKDVDVVTIGGYALDCQFRPSTFSLDFLHYDPLRRRRWLRQERQVAALGLIVRSSLVRNVRRTKSVGIGIYAVPVGPIERAIFQFDLEFAVSAVI